MTPMLRYDVASGGFKDLGMAWRQFNGLPDPGMPSWKTLGDYAKAPADEAWVYSCIRRRYTAAMSVPLKVYVKDGTRRVSADQSSNQAAKDLQNLLDDVNPVDMQAGDLKAYLEAGLAAWGEGYIKKVRGRLGGPPRELYWLPASDVTPIPEQGPAPVTAYAYQPNGLIKAETYPVKDMIAYRTVNLSNPRRGLSPLAAVRSEMRVNVAAAENTASTLENWGVPPGAWVVPKGADVSPQDQRLIKRAIAALRGPRNSGKTPVLPEGIDWKPIALNPKDAEWLAARKVSRMTICAALGVPLVLAGDDEKNTVYAAIRDAERVFWRNTMIPELDWIADGFNSWLVPDFTTQRDILIAFDYSAIEALKAPPAEEMAQWLEAVKLGLPFNRFLDRFGMGDPVEGGDESRVLLGRAGDVGLTPGDQSADAPVAPVSTTPASKPRPAEYNTARAAAASLGKGLYKHEAVKAYLTTGDPTVLEQLVPEHEVERLALGLQRRLPAAKLIEAWEPVAPPPAPAPIAPPQMLVAIDSARLEASAEKAMAAVVDDRVARHLEAVEKASKDASDRIDRSINEVRVELAEVRAIASAEKPKGTKVLERDERGRITAYVKDGDAYRVVRDEAGRIVETTRA